MVLVARADLNSMGRGVAGEALPLAASRAVDRPVELSAQLAAVHRLDIQGLRGLAVLLVVAFHAGFPVSGGFLGVDVFFVVSGFVITTMLTSELERTGRLRVGAFYARRVRRLLPALAAMTLFVAVIEMLASPAATQRTAGITGLFASTFSSNMYLADLANGYFDPSASLNPLLHTWTLAVEEQFYLVFPLLLVLLWWLGRRGSTASRTVLIVGSLACLAVCSVVLANWLHAGLLIGDERQADRFAFYLAPTRAWEFLAGALVALLTPLAIRALPDSARWGFGWVALGAIVCAAVLSPSEGAVPGVAVLPVLATGLLLAVGTGHHGGASRALSDRRLVWLGDLSYSLYLWHWPLIVFALAVLPGSGWAAPAAAAVALLPAWLSLRLIENPIRYGPRFRGRHVVGLAIVCVSLPLAACTAALAAHQVIAKAPAIASWNASQRLHADVTAHCDNGIPLGQRDRTRCVWHAGNAKGSVVLFGDSNAGQFTEPVVDAGHQAGYDVEVVTASSCPFVGLRVKRLERGEDPSCPLFSDGTIDVLTTEHPSLVIVAARTDKYVGSDAVSLAGPRGKFTNDPTEKGALWLAALAHTLRRLNGAGIPVVLVHPIPQMPDAPDGCAVVRILLHSCSAAIDRADVEASLDQATGIEQRALNIATRSFPLTFIDDLCGRRSCTSTRGNLVQYRDREHLSVQGSQALTGRFYESITARAS